MRFDEPRRLPGGMLLQDSDFSLLRVDDRFGELLGLLVLATLLRHHGIAIARRFAADATKAAGRALTLSPVHGNRAFWRYASA